MKIAKALQLMRASERIGLREMAKEIGISAPTLSRIENGGTCDIRTLTMLMVWLTSADKKAA